VQGSLFGSKRVQFSWVSSDLLDTKIENWGRGKLQLDSADAGHGGVRKSAELLKRHHSDDRHVDLTKIVMTMPVPAFIMKYSETRQKALAVESLVETINIEMLLRTDKRLSALLRKILAKRRHDDIR